MTKKFACIPFLQIAVGKDVVKEITRRALEDDTNVFVCFDRVVYSDDVRVLESLKEEANAKPPRAFQ